MKRILSVYIIVLLLSSLRICASHHTQTGAFLAATEGSQGHFPHTVQSSEENDQSPEGQESGKLLAFGALNALSTLALYNSNPDFKAYCDSQTHAGKHYVLRSIVVPSLLKVEQIKDEGFCWKDFLKLGATLTTFYGVKKVGDTLSIWESLRTGNLAKTGEVLKSYFNSAKRHSGKIIIGGAVLAASVLLWKLGNVLEASAEKELIDTFFHTLTPEQQMRIIASPELSALVADATLNPLTLKTHESFLAILTDEQKKLLHDTVDDFVNKNDPLALLEGLED
jgi:hypothetical protein